MAKIYRMRRSKTLPKDSRASQNQWHSKPRTLPPLGLLFFAAIIGAVATQYFAFGFSNHGRGIGAATLTGNGPFTMCSLFNRYTCIVDGDTIWYNGVKIRFLDID